MSDYIVIRIHSVYTVPKFKLNQLDGVAGMM